MKRALFLTAYLAILSGSGFSFGAIAVNDDIKLMPIGTPIGYPAGTTVPSGWNNGGPYKAEVRDDNTTAAPFTGPADVINVVFCLERDVSARLGKAYNIQGVGTTAAGGISGFQLTGYTAYAYWLFNEYYGVDLSVPWPQTSPEAPCGISKDVLSAFQIAIWAGMVSNSVSNPTVADVAGLDSMLYSPSYITQDLLPEGTSVQDALNAASGATIYDTLNLTIADFQDWAATNHAGQDPMSLLINVRVLQIETQDQSLFIVADPPPVPEPAAIGIWGGLGGLGLMASVLAARRRKRLSNERTV